jgi:hypothetical protein
MIFICNGNIVRTPARPLREDEEIKVLLGYRPKNALLVWSDGKHLLQVKNDQVIRIKWVMVEAHQLKVTK